MTIVRDPQYDLVWGRDHATRSLLALWPGDSPRILNLGSKDTDYGGVNVDIVRTGAVDVQGTALYLPFRKASFDVVVFSEVLEHLPRGSEMTALREISGVLAKGGTMILTTPIDTLVYTLSDPYFFFRGHRHYRKRALLDMLQEAGFAVEDIGVRGGIEERIWTYAHTLFVIPMNRPLPLWIRRMITRIYQEENPRGSTLSVVAHPSV
ncbi:MAG: methyltransferase domain-containing protein [Thermoplasmata archaeon]